MADAITIKALQDASLDAKSLEEVVNGDEAKQVTTRKGETYPSVKKAIKELFENGGIAARFKTLVELQASPLVDGDYALVADDTDDKNGIYIKDAGEWVKSKYDATSVFKKVVSTDSSTDILNIVDSNNTSVYKVDVDGRHFFSGLSSDLKTELDSKSAYADSIKSDIQQTISTANSLETIFEIKDANGEVTLKQDSSGDLWVSNIGNLSEALGGNGKSGTDASYDASRYSDNTLVVLSSPYYEKKQIVTAAQVNALGIFDHAVNFVRIPSITRIEETRYLLFFEARESGSDTSNISLGTAFINVDTESLDVTVSDFKVLHKSFTDAEGKLRTFMNPCGVLKDNGDIICMYVRRHSLIEHDLYVRKSSDGGLTWSTYTDISAMYKQDINLVCPCHQGVIKRHGDNVGRIVFPAWYVLKQQYSTGNMRAGFIYSDDGGDTWEMGDFAEYVGGNEVQCAEDIDGTLVFCIRIEGSTVKKVIARYNSKTGTYMRVANEISFTSASIMSGFIQSENKFDRSNPKLLFTACKTSDREGLVVHTSFNGGDTWESHSFDDLEDTLVGYTCIENISETHKLILWESQGTKNLDCAVVSLKNILK